ncbi:restriction endonuclease [Devosia sp.]|uniref:restriction endonuclease n=1 Tax=Devosia sp. TaxID=1871048 RepID=UPI003BA96E81
MGTVVQIIVGLAIGGFVLVVALWFLFTVIKAIVTVPLQYAANARGAAKVVIDRRITENFPDLETLRQLINQVRTFNPVPTPISVPTPARYRSILGALPTSRVPLLDVDNEMDFFNTEIAQQGFFTLRDFAPNQRVSEEPFIDDLDSIQRPSDLTVRQIAEDALAQTPAYDGTDLPAMAESKLPNLGSIPGRFDVPKPEIILPFWRGPLAFLNFMVRSANVTAINRHSSAVAAWNDLQEEYDAARDELKKQLIELQKRLAKANEARASSWRSANYEVAAARDRWEARKASEVNLLHSILERWDAGYLDDPADMAKVVLEFTLLPRWLPMAVASSFDADSGVLIVDVQFPDVGRVTWNKRVGDKVKPATKVEAKEANEHLYPALAIRYGCEVARAVNDNLVKTVVLNGWAYYIDRATGETKRAYVSSLLADVIRLRQLNLPEIDVVQAFNALKGVSARAQTVVPVAPIVPMNTNDRRFVDARDVLDGMSSEQNLATMDWEDFEHLCRELFEQEFASDGADVKITQASRDAGVDAIIFNPDQVKGGKIVVQAKRYAATVDVSAVRDLYGTVHNEGAMKGILVTTSTFGSDSYNFIANKPLTLINGGQLLQLLGKHGHNFRIDLDEAKKMAKERWSPKRETSDR